MRCPKCGAAATRVLDTEGGNAISGRFKSVAQIAEWVMRWGESSVYRKRRCCTCDGTFLTVEHVIQSEP